MSYRGFTKNPFVCMDDISGHMEMLNSVIYNPNIDDSEFNKRILFNAIKEKFNVSLTDEQLNRLTKYEKDQLEMFVNDLREILKNENKL